MQVTGTAQSSHGAGRVVASEDNSSFLAALEGNQCPANQQIDIVRNGLASRRGAMNSRTAIAWSITMHWNPVRTHSVSAAADRLGSTNEHPDGIRPDVDPSPNTRVAVKSRMALMSASGERICSYPA